MVKQDGLTDCKLGLQLLLKRGVQAAIKAAFYYHDPPRLGQELPAAEFPNNATNPNFYCYSATASYYWLMDTGWHVVLLLLAPSKAEVDAWAAVLNGFAMGAAAPAPNM